ncbi:MAG: type VI secretion system baseplate subunit TssF [Providencia sp.]|uniref:type VI secretion system baseplate subunit TssF n=1 Tax=Providencia sp. TaxID=589 RepID=UPI001B74CC03|nr:type VI secretion system baseplate subunit TssF [Providencia sp.]
MTSKSYFSNESKYLDELAEQVAIEKPHLVNLLSNAVQDPDSARLMDGLSYLSGNLHEQIDRQFPELINSLVNMLWPNYTRPVPSMTIMEYQYDNSIGHQAIKIPTGQPFIAKPIYVQDANASLDNLHQCRFSQSRDMWLLPVQITQIAQRVDSIEITFELDKADTLATLGLDKLCFYLNGAAYTTNQIYYLLSRCVKSASLVTDEHYFPLEKFAAKPIGFKKEDGLLPYPKNSYDGYRILQEYFCFPEAFMFMDIEGLEDIPLALKAKVFKLVIHFDIEIPEGVIVRDDSIKLNCIPAVNLFTMDSEAISLTGKEEEYVLSANYQKSHCFDIFSVEHVQGLRYPQNEKPYAANYTSFESFHHQSHYSKEKNDGYYRLKINQKENVIGYQHRLSFVRNEETQLQNCEESISVSLNCTNRDIAARLSSHSIGIDNVYVPYGALSASNILKPTLPRYPLLDSTLYWSELTNLSLNYQSLLNLTSLKQILQLYDLPAISHQQIARQSQKRLDALVSLQTEHVEHLYKGLPVRGLKTIITIHQNTFLCEGSLFLFCTVIAHFFALYTSINMFHELEVINLDNQEIYQWPAQINQQELK